MRTAHDFLRKGDVLMVTRIDRLARSIGESPGHRPHGAGARGDPQDDRAAD
jgi:hypothetical protein